MRVALGALLATALALGAGAPRAWAQDYPMDPVFFVHGHGEGSYNWISLANALLARGYPIELLRAIDLVPNDGGNRAAAEGQIAATIEAFLAEANAFLAAQGYTGPPKTRVDIVAHSMGGVSTRWYAAYVAPERVDTWISLAGPSHGTDVLCAFVGSDAGGAADLCPAYSTDPASEVQLGLNGLPGPDVDETPYGVGVDADGVAVVPPTPERRIFYATIRTDPDVWIAPVDSVVVDGAGGRVIALPAGVPAVETSPGNFLMTNGVTHDMTGDGDVLQLVVALLDAVEPEPVPDPVEQEMPGTMRGHGHIEAGGERHHFGFTIQGGPGVAAGQLEYRTRSGGRFQATTLVSVLFSDDPASGPGRRRQPSVDSVVLTGTGLWNDAPGYTFEAHATDGGEPGRGRDIFAITIKGPDGVTVAAAAGPLLTGNVQSRRVKD